MAQTEKSQTILIVDDMPENIHIIAGLLKDEYKIKVATSSRKGLSIACSKPAPDLILLDIMMPEMDGYEVCRQLKEEESTREIPIIFLTAKTEAADETKGFDAGAVDYITKPFVPAVVKARVKTHLDLVEERQKTEKLLDNILPKKIIYDLKNNGHSNPELFDDASVMFTDFVNFTPISSTMGPGELINELSEIFTVFDDIIENNQCERIKTIGDAYMAVCGIPQENIDHAKHLVQAGIQIVEYLKNRGKENDVPWQVRIGIHSGPLVGGIVGRKKYVFDVFGDTVNLASRVESSSHPMRVCISESTYLQIKDYFSFEDRGEVEIKGKGPVRLYFSTLVHDD